MDGRRERGFGILEWFGQAFPGQRAGILRRRELSRLRMHELTSDEGRRGNVWLSDRAVAGTNVLASGFARYETAEILAAEILDSWLYNRNQPVASAPIISELRRNA